MKLDLWKGLHYWKYGEWQAIDEKLKDLDKAHISWCPGRKNLFRALELCPMEQVRCVILGQDPYPNPEFATGLAFDIGSNPVYPPTVRAILKELKDDLDIVHTGNLEGWARQGVLLWNTVPSCEEGRSMSHDWNEWEPLTIEILHTLQERNIVIAGLGNHAKKFLKFVDEDKSEVMWYGHPSPRGRSSVRPFLGSRFFSTINDHLEHLCHEPIDWRL